MAGVEPDVFGIVTHRRKDRETYARFIEQRLISKIAEPATQRLITRMVDERLKKEIDAIIATRAALTMAEMEAIQFPSGPSTGAILLAVSDATGYSIAELVGPRRARPVARARMVAYHLIQTLRRDLSLPAIGRVMGYRDHTTIMHGLRVFEANRHEDPMATWLAHPAIAALLKP